MKKQILLLVMIIAVAGVVSGCVMGKSDEANNRIVNNQSQALVDQIKLPANPKEFATSSDDVKSEKVNFEYNFPLELARLSSIENKESVNRLKYKNENFGFQLFYLKGWNYKIYENTSNNFKMGFFPENKTEGWEYNGDILVSVIYNSSGLTLENWYKELWNNQEPKVEKYEELLTRNNNKVIIQYKTPDMYGGSDEAYLICGQNIFIFDAVAQMSTKEMMAMVDNFECFIN